MNEKSDFKEEQGPVFWKDLAAHHAKGVLYLVHPKLELSYVLEIFATDQVNQVKIWLDNNELYKPSDQIIKNFIKDNTALSFVIAEPFIIAKIKEPLLQPS